MAEHQCQEVAHLEREQRSPLLDLSGTRCPARTQTFGVAITICSRLASVTHYRKLLRLSVGHNHGSAEACAR